MLGVSDGTPGPDLPAALLPGAQARARARRSRSRTRSPATGRRGSCAPDFVGLDRRSTATTSLNPVARRDRARPRDPRDRRRLDPVRRDPAQGRGPALHALPPRRRARRQRRRRRAHRAALARSPGVDTVTNPGAGQRRRRRRDARRTRASARRWRSARATAPSPPRTSSSWPARRRRASRARSASRRRSTGGPVALHLVPRLIPADRQLAYDELVPDEELLQEVSEYLDERRLIGTTVQLLPCAYRGLSVVVNLQASPARRHRARRGGRRARALHVPQPAGGRQPDGPRRRAGRSAARSTRASCTASSTPSTASSS